MAWTDIKKSYLAMKSALERGESPSDVWLEFKAVVESEHKKSPPYHLIPVLTQIERMSEGKARSEIAILDHGCGSALTLLYLAAVGYTDIWGVDIETSDCEIWNALTGQCFGHEGQRFFAYDGMTLPIADDTIDFVISQEVLEHVTAACLDAYYGEEARVMRRGAAVLHSVPHRLVPYESHTKTWLLHMVLPHSVWIALLKLFGRSNNTAENYLFLRWPWDHRRMLNRYFTGAEDLTLERLRGLDVSEYYDGSSRLRQIVSTLSRYPLIGPLLSNFVMADTLAYKA
ncbi:class I SAM-dependent methyltransferase [Rhodospirillaceae bacterium KN72]|uniref:Class I SAM-dependent methyltransferase n=1 Tax=Pacificispira spongiicola TaxID=2729598 RepID=A0A7Y0HGF1_9PROT|nr:class I SAM-dependent methyltransferase [Pacificispira spongiicola]NMM45608.1 class I SAM-dependent methyltransferase [Pacificispira spongiicola]